MITNEVILHLKKCHFISTRNQLLLQSNAMQGKVFVFKLHCQNFTKSHWNPIIPGVFAMTDGYRSERLIRVSFPWNQLWLVERVMCYSLNTYLGISNHKHTRGSEISAALLFTHLNHQLLLIKCKGVVWDRARMPLWPRFTTCTITHTLAYTSTNTHIPDVPQAR